MKVLFFSNKYPPDAEGGYELGCMQILQALQARGHECHLITFQLKQSLSPRNSCIRRILKKLPLYPQNPVKRKFFLFTTEFLNGLKTRRYIHKFKPDAIYLWNCRDFSTSVLNRISESKIPVHAYFFDLWFERLNAFDMNMAFPENVTGLKKFLQKSLSLCGLAPLHYLNRIHGQFCSSMVREHARKKLGNGLLSETEIPFGINISAYHYDNEKILNDELQLLFAGRVCPAKGFDICLQTVRILHENRIKCRLTAVGWIEPHHRKNYENMLYEFGIADKVTFSDPVDRCDMAKKYNQADILLFSSVCNEGYGLVPLEAMASGTVVVATGDGGSKDFCQDGKNCLLYSPYSAEDCAKKIMQLLNDRQLYYQLRRRGREFVEENLKFEQTVKMIEYCLTTGR